MILNCDIKIREEERVALADTDQRESDEENNNEDAEEENLHEVLHRQVLEEVNEEIEIQVREPKINDLGAEGELKDKIMSGQEEFRDEEDERGSSNVNQNYEFQKREEDDYEVKHREIVGKKAQEEMDELL
jgi:hypothetical protein